MSTSYALIHAAGRLGSGSVKILADSGLNSDPSDPNAVKGLGMMQTLIGYTAWIGDAIAIATLLGVGVQMVLNFQQGGGAEDVKALGRWFGGAALVASASALAGSMFGFSLFTSDAETVPGLSGVQTGIGVAAYIAEGMCLLGIIWTGVLMMLRHRRGEPMGERLVYVMIGCVLIGGAGTIVNTLLP
ncbi:MAG: hypothetical protein JWN95_1356 [Frankiales bacterium]|nr:hypothetical protein [Frankiales bacterium]